MSSRKSSTRSSSFARGRVAAASTSTIEPKSRKKTRAEEKKNSAAVAAAASDSKEVQEPKHGKRKRRAAQAAPATTAPTGKQKKQKTTAAAAAAAAAPVAADLSSAVGSPSTRSSRPKAAAGVAAAAAAAGPKRRPQRQKNTEQKEKKGKKEIPAAVVATPSPPAAHADTPVNQKKQQPTAVKPAPVPVPAVPVPAAPVSVPSQAPAPVATPARTAAAPVKKPVRAASGKQPSVAARPLSKPGTTTKISLVSPASTAKARDSINAKPFTPSSAAAATAARATRNQAPAAAAPVPLEKSVSAALPEDKPTQPGISASAAEQTDSAAEAAGTVSLISSATDPTATNSVGSRTPPVAAEAPVVAPVGTNDTGPAAASPSVATDSVNVNQQQQKQQQQQQQPESHLSTASVPTKSRPPAATASSSSRRSSRKRVAPTPKQTPIPTLTVTPSPTPTAKPTAKTTPTATTTKNLKEVNANLSDDSSTENNSPVRRDDTNGPASPAEDDTESFERTRQQHSDTVNQSSSVSAPLSALAPAASSSTPQPASTFSMGDELEAMLEATAALGTPPKKKKLQARATASASSGKSTVATVSGSTGGSQFAPGRHQTPVQQPSSLSTGTSAFSAFSQHQQYHQQQNYNQQQQQQQQWSPLNQRVAVWWAGNTAWYFGRCAWVRDDGFWLVVYDDDSSRFWEQPGPRCRVIRDLAEVENIIPDQADAASEQQTFDPTQVSRAVVDAANRLAAVADRDRNQYMADFNRRQAEQRLGQRLPQPYNPFTAAELLKVAAAETAAVAGQYSQYAYQPMTKNQFYDGAGMSAAADVDARDEQVLRQQDQRYLTALQHQQHSLGQQQMQLYRQQQQQRQNQYNDDDDDDAVDDADYDDDAAAADWEGGQMEQEQEQEHRFDYWDLGRLQANKQREQEFWMYVLDLAKDKHDALCSRCDPHTQFLETELYQLSRNMTDPSPPRSTAGLENVFFAACTFYVFGRRRLFEAYRRWQLVRRRETDSAKATASGAAPGSLPEGLLASSKKPRTNHHQTDNGEEENQQHDQDHGDDDGSNCSSKKNGNSEHGDGSISGKGGDGPTTLVRLHVPEWTPSALPGLDDYDDFVCFLDTCDREIQAEITRYDLGLSGVIPTAATTATAADPPASVAGKTNGTDSNRDGGAGSAPLSAAEAAAVGVVGVRPPSEAALVVVRDFVRGGGRLSKRWLDYLVPLRVLARNRDRVVGPLLQCVIEAPTLSAVFGAVKVLPGLRNQVALQIARCLVETMQLAPQALRAMEIEREAGTEWTQLSAAARRALLYISNWNPPPLTGIAQVDADRLAESMPESVHLLDLLRELTNRHRLVFQYSKVTFWCPLHPPDEPETRYLYLNEVATCLALWSKNLPKPGGVELI